MPGAPCDTLIDESTGIEKSQFSEQTKMYPNPARNIVILENPSTPIHSIYIYNANGKLINMCEPLSKTCELETGHLPNGLYFIRILSNDFIESKTLIKH